MSGYGSPRVVPDPLCAHPHTAIRGDTRDPVWMPARYRCRDCGFTFRMPGPPEATFT